MPTQIVNRALNDINKCFSSLLLETNFNLENDIVSWPNYTPGIPTALAYAAEYQRLIDKKQFSFLLMDSSFFQFYFKFKNNTIISARLAYYPAPVKISGAFDDIAEVAEHSGVDLLEELYFGAENWVERGIDIINTSHLRLDYDSQASSHSPCHIQFGGINEMRLPSDDLINPFVFFEWICNGTGKDFVKGHHYQHKAAYHLNRNFKIGGLDGNYPHFIAKK